MAGNFYYELQNTPIYFNRLTNKNETNYITNIKLFGLDTRNERIRLEYCEKPYIGKSTDRIYATLTCSEKLSKEQEKMLIAEFNKHLEEFRKQYFDLCLTNYRDFNRKRISFTFVYQLLSKIYIELKRGEFK